MLGYAGYYVCRSNYSVCLPLLAAELSRGGLGPEAARLRLGEIASLGVLAYAIGKFASGALADFLGGRRAFLSGMGLSIGFTLLFAASGGLPLFTLSWMGNRLVQSIGWPGLVKLTGRWFHYSAYAGAMGVLSLSFLFGDAAARWLMGVLLGAGFGWRAIFVAAAGLLAVLLALAAALLREAPGELGLPEPDANPANLFAEWDTAGPGATRIGVAALLLTFAKSSAFAWACAVSLGLTLLRETFNTWTPTYFVEALRFAPEDGARWSALFPLFGGLSVLAAGWLGDRLGSRGRAWVIVVGLGLSALSLLALGRLAPWLGAAGGVALVALTGFLMLGPYSYLAGAISLDFGGKQGGATACGVVDGVGYLGGVLAGGGVARIVGRAGWEGAFATLAGVALATAACGLLLLRSQPRRPPKP